MIWIMFGIGALFGVFMTLIGVAVRLRVDQPDLEWGMMGIEDPFCPAPGSVVKTASGKTFVGAGAVPTDKYFDPIGPPYPKGKKDLPRVGVGWDDGVSMGWSVVGVGRHRFFDCGMFDEG